MTSRIRLSAHSATMRSFSTLSRCRVVSIQPTIFSVDAARTTTWSRLHGPIEGQRHEEASEDLQLPHPIWETGFSSKAAPRGQQQWQDGEVIAQALTTAHDLALERQAREIHDEWNVRHTCEMNELELTMNQLLCDKEIALAAAENELQQLRLVMGEQQKALEQGVHCCLMATIPFLFLCSSVAHSFNLLNFSLTVVKDAADTRSGSPVDAELLMAALISTESLLLGALLDKAHHQTTPSDLACLPPMALAGVGKATAAALSHVQIDSIAALASWPVLAEAQEAVESGCDTTDLVDTLHSVSACKANQTTVQALKLRTVGDAASWKYGQWAQALMDLRTR
eukprot:SAG31_NODE_397_length_16251_cov_7.922486_10_plen_340_part_00